ncbi:hypothetical protein AMTR_s00159p00018390 [Amborella trichopoda]|uniref:Uncharacterized protein n=1 Tax=Amborella trichopoda TaxID=13333 RepID=W1PVI5_AMBTC|nr:hypothetical protein AMTR_s00159p00018390 [Amborella trichopoda]
MFDPLEVEPFPMESDDEMVPIQAIVEDQPWMDEGDHDDVFDSQGALVESEDQAPLCVQPVIVLLLLPGVDAVEKEVADNDKLEENKVATMFNDVGLGFIYIEFKEKNKARKVEFKEKKKARKFDEASEDKAPVEVGDS